MRGVKVDDFQMIGGEAAEAAQAIKKDKWIDLAGYSLRKRYFSTSRYF